MIIKKVDNIKDAIECNKLLTNLINNERKYDTNIKSDYIVNKYFENIYANKNNCLFIAKDNNNLVIGYAFCKMITSDDGPYINHIALIDGLYVNQEYRQQGVATKLIEECKTWAIEAGATIIELNVMSENINAINLYENIGFKELEKKMRLFFYKED
jgi:ribosomal protein S18 acetylase RimI-like enzyme